MLLIPIRVLTAGLLILIHGVRCDPLWRRRFIAHNDICQSGWMHYSGSCYKLIKTKQTWTRAQEACEKLGANLATISNSMENEAVSALMPCVHIDCQAWFGLNDREEDGHFVWFDTNQSVSWTHWGTSPETEPNNWPTYEKGTENCVSLRPDGYWNDASCDARSMYICEFSLQEVVGELEENLGTTSNTIENGAVADPLPRENVGLWMTLSTYSFVPFGPFGWLLTNPLQKVNYAHNDICQSGWMHYSGSCYKLIKTQQTWTRAQEACEKRGANLATISNSMENEAVSALMPCVHIDCQAWFGLNDRVEDGHFVWFDTNQSVSWTHWGTSPEIEPNNWPTYEKGTENCVSLRPDGYWNDFSCDAGQMYICESSVEVASGL